MGPKFSSFGLKPGTKYKHVGIPPKYICAITSSNKAYYASQRVLEFINNLSNVRNKEENETLNVDLYSADELF